MNKDSVIFIAQTENGEVSGWYWENYGIGYIVSKDETIQPPIKRTYVVDPDKVRVELR